MFQMFENDTVCIFIFFYRTEYKRRSWTLNKQCYTDIKYDSEFHCGEYLKKNYGGGGHARGQDVKLQKNNLLKC